MAVFGDVSEDTLGSTLTSLPVLHALLLAERGAVAAERTVAAAERAGFLEQIALLEAERDNLRKAHERLREELELFKRRIFIAKAERIDTAQLEIEFGEKMKELEVMARTLGMADEPEPESKPEPAADGKPIGKRTNNRGTGRRPVNELALPEDRIEVPDPHLEALVHEGKVIRHGFDESCKLGHRRACRTRVVVARVRYKTVDAEGHTDIITTAMPKEMLPSALGAPSLVAHVTMENIGKGLPLFRIEDSFAREGIPISRGTLSRWKKGVGDGMTPVVLAMRQHALATAFCISTDATGVSIQPVSNEQKTRQPCKKGHFLVSIADRDHILYDYLEKETGVAIHKLFRGFQGYVQADAKSVFNLLFADERALKKKAPVIEHDGCQRTEVGCWYHCRRRFWEAAVTKCKVGREGLMRIHRIFELDASWKKKPPSEIKKLRAAFLRPHVESFFAWVESERPSYAEERGYTRTALEYAHNQREALTRFFDDGRLVLTNNGSERALKTICLGRRAWLFCGSDDHAKSTAALYSLLASARLHKLDPEEYLRCLIRIVPLWPAHRMLELSPLFWQKTRARLDPKELARELGPITVPAEPLDTASPSTDPSPPD